MTKREDGLWQQKITIEERGRKKQKYFYGRTKREVLDKIRNYKEKEKAGPTFEAVADEWWEKHEKEIAHNTAKPYRPAVKRAIEELGAMRIKELRPVDIKSFIEEFVKETNAAQKTAKTQLTVVNLACKYAVENGYIDSNPCRDVSIPKGLKKEPRKIASDEDIAIVKKSRDCTFGDFAYWTIYTGLRRGELMGLKWEDINLKERTISVRRSIYHDDHGAPHVKEPKTEAGIRTIPILDALYAVMDKKRKRGWVFPAPDGGPLWNGQIEWRLKLYARESGIKSTPHQMRHAYATMLFDAGIDAKDAQALLGHAQESTTRDIYTHIRESRAKKIREKILSIDYEDPEKKSV